MWKRGKWLLHRVLSVKAVTMTYTDVSSLREGIGLVDRVWPTTEVTVRQTNASWWGKVDKQVQNLVAVVEPVQVPLASYNCNSPVMYPVYQVHRPSFQFVNCSRLKVEWILKAVLLINQMVHSFSKLTHCNNK